MNSCYDIKVFVVDNDMEDERYAGKRSWLHEYPDAIVIRNPVTRHVQFWNDHDPNSNHHHGAGIDLAVDYCRRQRYGFLLYFEPDCLVAGRAWVDNMWQEMQRGAWVAGGNIAAHANCITCSLRTAARTRVGSYISVNSSGPEYDDHLQIERRRQRHFPPQGLHQSGSGPRFVGIRRTASSSSSLDALTTGTFPPIRPQDLA